MTIHLLSALIVREGEPQSLELTSQAHAWEVFGKQQSPEFWIAQQALHYDRPVWLHTVKSFDEFFEDELPEEIHKWITEEPTYLKDPDFRFNARCRFPCGLMIADNAKKGMGFQKKIMDFVERTDIKARSHLLVAVLDVC